MNKDLEERIDKAITELSDNDRYGWADVIYTLVECRRELDSWKQAALSSSYTYNRPRLDIYADQ
jgi:hypothetical protein